MDVALPTYDELFNPLIRALRALGGSGSIQELYDKVVELEQLPESVLAQLHNEDGNMTEVGYRLAWARTYLKKVGILENSQRGVWSLTAEARDLDKVNAEEIVRSVRSASALYRWKLQGALVTVESTAAVSPASTV